MLSIGILGAAGIAPAAIVRPARRRNDVVVAAVASRRASTAADYAATHGIERELLDDQLEAVIAGLATGKRMLTEGHAVANMRVIDAIYASAGFDRSALTGT